MVLGSCPTDKQLSAFHRGELDDAALSEVAEHIDVCSQCETTLTQLQDAHDPVLEPLRGISFDTSPTELPPPKTIGEYDVVGELGRGGLGVVYQAKHQKLGHDVALKMLLVGSFAGTEFLRRFQSEARAVAHLNHPGIVRLFSVGDHNGQPYFAMELIRGESLSERVKAGPQNAETVAKWVLSMARAIDYAHSRGIVHRDLKPSNVLLTEDGEPRICDFGVARHLDEVNSMTMTGQLVGTPEYMSPEQASGQAQQAGPAADVYSLGVLMYALLTGRPPFLGATLLETLNLIRWQEPRSPSLLQRNLPRDLTTICMKCLEKEPQRRYASAGALADDIDRFLAGQTILARQSTLLERTWKWSRRKPAVAMLLAMIAGVTFFGVPLLTWLLIRSEQALELATEKENDAKAAMSRSEDALYASYIQLSDAALQDDDIAECSSWLDRCGTQNNFTKHVGWEYRFLRSQCKSDLIPGRRHSTDGWVTAVAYLPNGQIISAAENPYSNSSAGSLVLWSIDRNSPVIARDFRRSIRQISVAPDGRLIAIALENGEISLLDPETLNVSRQLYSDSSAGMLTSVQFSPSGRQIAVVRGELLALWDLDTGLVWERPICGDGDWIQIAFRPDGKQLAAAVRRAFAPGPLTILDTATGQEVPHLVPERLFCGLGYFLDHTFQSSASDQSSASHSADNPSWQLRVVSTSTSEPHLEVWDVDQGVRLTGNWRHPRKVDVAVVGTHGLVASTGNDQTIRVWTSRGDRGPILRGHQLGIASLAISPDEKQLVSGGKDATVRTWDLTRDPRFSSCRPFPSGLGEWLGNFTFSPDSKNLIAVGQHLNQINPSGVQNHDETLFLEVYSLKDSQRQPPTSMELSADPKHLQPNRRMSFSGDGCRFAAFDLHNRITQNVKVFDTRTAELLATCTKALPTGLTPALNGDGRLLVFGSVRLGAGGVPEESELVLFDVESRVSKTIETGSKQLLGPLALSYDGRLLAAAVTCEVARDHSSELSPAGVIQLWETRSGRELATYQTSTWRSGTLGSTNTVFSVAINHSANRIAATGPGNTVQLWDVQEPDAPLERLVGPGELTMCVTFSPDGRRLAAAGRNNRVKLWDAQTGHELLTLNGGNDSGNGHYGFTSRVVFSPDGRSIAANQWDGVMTIWDAPQHTD